MTKIAKTEEILSTARSLIGTRFFHQGRSRESGLDCVGLLVLVARETGIPHVDSTQYGKNGVLKKTLEETISLSLEKVAGKYVPGQLQPGDVLLVLPSHAMIVSETAPEVKVIEAHPDYGVTERRIDRQILRYVYAVYRFPGGLDAYT